MPTAFHRYTYTGCSEMLNRQFCQPCDAISSRILVPYGGVGELETAPSLRLAMTELKDAESESIDTPHYWLVSEEAEVCGHGVDKRKNKSEKRSE